MRYGRFVAMLWQFLTAVAALCATSPTQAQSLPEGQHMAASLLAEGSGQAGGTVWLALLMQPQKGWHGYWSNPGDAGFGMGLEWNLPAGAATGAPRYPVPGTLVIAGLMNHVFEDDYAVLVPLTIPASAKAGDSLPVKLKADWLVCSAEICVPERAELSTIVKIGPPTTSDPRFDQWRAKLPAPLGSEARFAGDSQSLRFGIPLPASVKLEEPHLFIAEDHAVAYAPAQDYRRQGDLLVVTLAKAPGTDPAPTNLTGVLRLDKAGDGVAFTARPGPVPAGGDPIAAGAAPAAKPASLALLLGLALAGGLLLNIMPCVFPILSLKAISLARAGESAAHARIEGLAYAAGVILACAGLGALLLALRAAGHQVGWAFQLQDPIVVVVLLLLAVAITVNLAGVFELAVPGFASAGSPRHGDIGGAFATGLLAAFVATPCTGPFMAAAMGAALLLPPAEAMLLFLALGLGLALPFLALAFVPALRKALPRPGAWMNWFRKAMAVPMGLTALALGWLASRLGGNAFAILAVIAALALIALLAWLGRRQRAGKAGGSLFTGGLLALAAAAAGLILPHAYATPSDEDADLLAAKPFSEAALAQARASGKPVFLWFTADWCLTCKVNERLAIEKETTRSAFAKAGVVVLRGDWTRRDPAITRFLTAQGAAGVPLYLWYPAGGTPRQLPQVLTPDSLAALAQTPG